MPKGVSVEVADGYALIEFVDPTKKGPALAKLIAAGTPIQVDTSGRNTRRYRVPEGNARDAGLIDAPIPRPVKRLRRNGETVQVKPRTGNPSPTQLKVPESPDIRDTKVIVFVFAGRRPNMELQVPFMRRILAENPNVEYHIWDLARNNADSRYLQTLKGSRIVIRNEFRGKASSFESVYRTYTDQRYKGHVFVKLDDDIVFIQTHTFRKFIHAIVENPEAVVSSHVINNGACTPLEPKLFKQFKEIKIPLLNVHTSTEYADISHDYFFDHHTEMLSRPVELTITRDWLSINTIGYTWGMARKIADLVGTVCAINGQPRMVAGRPLTTLGDEGVVNTLPRRIMKGFVTCHLTFGPQRLTASKLKPWRQRYSEIAQDYLGIPAAEWTSENLALSST